MFIDSHVVHVQKKEEKRMYDIICTILTDNALPQRQNQKKIQIAFKIYAFAHGVSAEESSNGPLSLLCAHICFYKLE